MPQLPQPLKQQLGQLVRGTFETVREQPKEMAKTALEQVGVSGPKKENESPQSVLKPSEILSSEAIEQKRHNDLMKTFQLVKQLEQEQLQIHHQQIQQKEEAAQQAELTKQHQVQAAQENSTVAPPEPRRKRGMLGGDRPQKQSSSIASALEKSHAETVGKRVSG
jgi:hypothetical protein